MRFIIAMPLEHMSNLDLNLLRTLDAILEEESVTATARRLRLTQPAVSRALARLRDHLGDPLLVRAGRRMVLTARARAIGRPLRQALRQLDAAIGTSAPFAPAACHRTFRIATADYAAAVIAPALMTALARLAPRATLELLPQEEDFSAALEAGRLDLVVVPRRDAWAGVVWRPLFRDHYVCALRRGHPFARGGRLGLAAFCELRHVLVSPRGRGPGVVDEALSKLGRTRHVAARVPSFLLAARLVAESDLVLTAFSRLVAPARNAHGLRALAAPLALPHVALSMAWHESAGPDPAHAWFRALVAQTAAAL
jgi:DNA-binding transcriptional LysR family regulator